MTIGKEFFISFMEESIKTFKEESSDQHDIRERPVIKKLALTGHGKGDLGVSGKSTPHHVNKRWGSEDIYQNNDLYCAKLLTIEPGTCTSMHFHLEKHETMINVGEGTLYIDYIVDLSLIHI